MTLSSDLVAPKVSLTDLAGGSTLPSSARVLSFSLTWELDKPDTLAVVFRLAEVGDAAGGASFASGMIAAGGTDAGAAALPTMLGLSLDGTNYDSYKLIELPTRDLEAGNLRISDAGDSLYILYAGVGVDRATYTNVKLIDALGAAAGTIIPLANASIYGTQTDFICAPGGPIPTLAGIFKNLPADATAWVNKSLLVYTPCLDIAVRDLGTNIDIYADYVAKALDTIVQRLGGKTIAGDTVVQSSRGHVLVDSSDAALNLSARAALYTAAAPTTATNTTGGQGKSIIIGRVGAAPYLTFDGNDSAPPDETTTARILDKPSIAADFAGVVGEARFEGGPSNAGFPGGYKITNIHSVTHSGAISSDWNYFLPIFSVYVNDTTGGLYYAIGDSQVRLTTPSVGCYDFAVDGNDGVIYVATAGGVYAIASDDVTAGAPIAALVQIGGLTGRVIKVQALGSGGWLACHVKGSGADIDGIYVTQVTVLGGGAYTAAPVALGDTDPVTIGHQGWSKVAGGSTFADFVITDKFSVLLVDSQTSTLVEQYDYTSGVTTFQGIPNLANGRHLSRIFATVPSAADTIWVGTDDATGLYYGEMVSGVLGTLYAGNDGSMAAPDTGQNLQVYRVIGPNVTINGQYVARLACTNNGLWWYNSFPTGAAAATWRSANGENGLGGIPITSVAAVDTQTVAGVTVQRLHAINDTQFFFSNSFGNFWQDLTRAKVDGGPFFSALAFLLLPNDFPSNNILTISPDAPSATNIYLDTTLMNAEQITLYGLASGWYWSRHLDDHNNWAYATLNRNAPRPDVLYHQFADLQTNTLVTPLVASSELMLASKTALGQRSKAETRLTISSFFEQQNAKLRLLRPTDLVAVTYAGTLTEYAEDGTTIVATPYVTFAGTTFYVIAHTIARPDSPSAQVETVTTLSNFLRRNDLNLDDIIAQMAFSLKNIRAFGSR